MRLQQFQPIVTSTVRNRLQWELDCQGAYGLSSVAPFISRNTSQIVMSHIIGLFSSAAKSVSTKNVNFPNIDENKSKTREKTAFSMSSKS